MFSSNSVKFFFAVALLSCQACSFWQSRTDATTAPSAPPSAGELTSAIPFSTKEPDAYQTEIVITTGSDFTEKTFVAVNGANRLIIFGYQEKRETALMRLGENQSYLIAHDRKIFTENESGTAAGDREANPNDFLTAEWLNQTANAKFEALGAENNLVKYRVRLNDSPSSEIVIYVDEKIGLPVKQEFYTTSGEQKTLTSTMELKNFSPLADAKLFEVPKDYRKVSTKEFHEILRRETAKEK